MLSIPTPRSACDAWHACMVEDGERFDPIEVSDGPDTDEGPDYWRTRDARDEFNAYR